MKVYLLKIKYYYENIKQNNYEIEVYSSLDRAIEEGKYFLSKRKNDEGFRDYKFTVTQTDPKYTERFYCREIYETDMLISLLDIYDDRWIDVCGMYEPTHIVYFFDIEGNLQYKLLKYIDIQRKYIGSIKVYPEDKLGVAGKKFKIGDIVRVKAVLFEDNYIVKDGFVRDQLYIIENLPRRKKGQKYFKNTYKLLSISNYGYMPGLLTYEAYESHIEKYDGLVEEDSFISILSKIMRKEINVSNETWQLLINGEVSFDTRKRFNEIEELKNLLEKEGGNNGCI